MELILLIRLIKKKTGQTNNNGKIDNVEIMVPLKYLSNFWRTLELIVKFSLLWNCQENCVMIYTNVANQVPTLTITGANLYVPVVTLSTQETQLKNYKIIATIKIRF